MTEFSIPNFSSQTERTQWIIDHADTFVMVRRANRRNYRAEVGSLDVAIQQARALVAKHPEARILIYAVSGPVDTWCATVSHNKVYMGTGNDKIKPWKA